MRLRKCSKISGRSIFIRICLFYIKFSSTASSLGKSTYDSPQSWRLQTHCLELPYTQNGQQQTTDSACGEEGIRLLPRKPGMPCLLSVQFSCSGMSDSATPWTTARQASLSITNSQSSPKPMSIESVMPSSHLTLCHPLLLLPPIPPSIRVFFQWVSSSHQVAKVLEFQLQHQSFQWTLRTDIL